MAQRLSEIEQGGPRRLSEIAETMRLSEIEEPEMGVFRRAAEQVSRNRLSVAHAQFAGMEAGAQLLSGMVATPVSGIAGLVMAPFGRGAETVRGISEAMTYQPKTEAGREAGEMLLYPFEKLQEGIGLVGGKAFELTGSPAVGAGVETTLNAALIALGARGARTTKKPAKAPAEAPVTAAVEPPKLVEVTLSPQIQTRAAQFLGKDFADTTLPDKAVNINFKYLDTADDVKGAINQVAELYKPAIEEARRATISHVQTVRLARDLNMSPVDLLARRKGQAFNAEEAFAARSMLVQSGEELVSVAKKAGSGSDADLLAFQQQLQRHAAIQQQLSGLTAEAGRALSQFRIQAGSDIAREKAIQHALKVTGRENVQQVAKMIEALDSPEALNKFVMDLQKPKISDILLETWINALLSGPQTHVVNSLSNTLTSLLQIPERAVAGVIGKLHGGEKVLLRESAYQVAGWAQGVKDGLRAFWQVVKKGDPLDELSKLEAMKHRAITGAGLGLKGAVGKAVDVIGEVVRIPGRLLMAEDELFKAIASRSEMNALAIRQAVKEGPHDVAVRAQELLANPTKEMIDAANHAARYVTFTKPLGPAGQAVQHMAKEQPALRVVIPFIRTPLNIVKFAGERTLLAPLSKSVREELAKGGAARDIQLARIAVGTSVGAYIAYLAADGNITGGGPSDPDLKRSLRDTGWQPYSIKIGDTYYAYNRLEPLGILFGVSADMAEIYHYIKSDEEKKELASMITKAVAQNLTNKTFLRGLTDLVNTLSDPDRYGERWIQSLAGTAVPTAVAQYTRTQDPVLRATETVLDRIKSRIPGYSEELPPRRNAFGDPIILEGGVGPDLLSPIYESKQRNDPVYNEIAKLKLDIAMPEKKLFGSELNALEYDRYVVLQGRLVKPALDQLVARPEYADLPDWAKRDTIKKVVEDSRRAARIQMVSVIGRQRFLEGQMKRFKEVR